MIQHHTSETTERDPSPRIWGLNAVELHDAFWNAHGVQCIRRGESTSIQKGADLYLLIEPDQLVLFDLRELIDRITWRAARLTRLRVVTSEENAYREQVAIDDDQRVISVGRHYRPRTHAAFRVILTRSRRDARLWMDAEVRRDAWRRLRVLAGGSNIDNWRCPGHWFNVDDHADSGRLISLLMEHWPSPDRAIVGIEEIAEGVWGPSGHATDPDSVVVGPAWIGLGREDDENQHCLIGPTWLGDDSTTTNSEIRVRQIHEIDPGEAPAEEAQAPAPSVAYAAAKRLLDLAASSVGLILLAPILTLISIAILIDDGRPILFGHRRQTRGGKTFPCWKFRTMRRDADEIKRRLEEQNLCDGPQFYIENDPRVTRVGRFLRKSHLDELPQLWNVFLGQMSLVGPRPSPDNENQFCPAWREIRLSVRPGITGLWQLRRSRKPGLDFQEWIRFDTEYVQQASFWLDIRILVATIVRVLFRPIRNT